MKPTVASEQRAHIAPIRAEHRHGEARDRPPGDAFNRQAGRLCVWRDAAATRGRADPRPLPPPGATPPREQRCPPAAAPGTGGTTRESPASRDCGPRRGAACSCPRRGRGERPQRHLAAPRAKAAARTRAHSVGGTPHRIRAGAGSAARVQSGADVHVQGALRMTVDGSAPTLVCGRELRTWLQGEPLASLGTSGLQHLATIPSGHSRSKAVAALPFDDARLVGSFHLASIPPGLVPLVSPRLAAKCSFGVGGWIVVR